MNPERIRANVAVTLVGAGRVDPAQLRRALLVAPRLLAADGGAHRAWACGMLPEAVIGDLDSLGPQAPWRARGVAIHHIPEQESTDFAKCLALVEAPLYLALGFAGDRLDHLLAALSVLAGVPERRVILLGDGDLCFLAPLTLALDLPEGMRVSLWPVAPTRVVEAQGLVWPARGLLLEPAGRIGTSNAARSGPVRLRFDRRGVFVILPAAALAAAIGAFSIPVD
ncbi:MAG: thiamine diphosphokinase [Pseudomonadota bacterium]